jgi:uncharacterized membrane protein YfcA
MIHLLPALGLILPAVFLAGVVDSMAGGGGLLSVPAYLAAGLPPHLALGNNKFSSAAGTLFATLRYHQGRLIDTRVALLAGGLSLLGAMAGSRVVLLVNPGFLRYLLVALIPLITLFTLFNQSLGRHNLSAAQPLRRKYLLSALAGLLIGFYDVFFGPGTGTFLILFYTIALKYDFVTANANTKVANLASNLGALAVFIAKGQIVYLIGVPAMAAGVAGNLLGAQLVLKKGNRAIRPIFVGVLVLLFAKIVYDLLVR